MQIINLTAEHLSEIVALEQREQLDRWSSELFAAELELVSVKQLGALIDGKLVAFSLSRICGFELEILKLTVADYYRRQGVAKQLLLTILNTEGIARATLEVRATNLPAISLYQKMGFAEVGRRKSYYSNPTCDALLLDRVLE